MNRALPSADVFSGGGHGRIYWKQASAIACTAAAKSHQTIVKLRQSPLFFQKAQNQQAAWPVDESAGWVSELDRGGFELRLNERRMSTNNLTTETFYA